MKERMNEKEKEQMEKKRNKWKRKGTNERMNK